MKSESAIKSEWAIPLLFVLTLASLLVMSPEAQATSCGTAQYYQDGVDYSSVYAKGSLAEITVAGSALCTPSSGAAYAASWVMLQDSGSHYAQIGWTRNSGVSSGAASYFYQWGDGGTPNTAFWGTPTNGDNERYKSTWQDGQDGYIHLIQCAPGGGGCVDYDDTMMSPANWDARVATMKGETNYDETHMPGNATTHEAFTSVMTRLDGANLWANNTPLEQCNAGCGSNLPSNYHFAWNTDANAGKFDIWTA